MADGFVGAAYVQIQPSFVGFQQQVGREIGRSMSTVGRDAGRQLSREMSRSVGNGRDLIPRRGMASEAQSAGQEVASKLGGALGRISVTGLEKVGDALRTMGRTAATAAGVATAAMVGFAAANVQTYVKAQQFENALSLVGKQMGVSNVTINDGIRRMVGLGSSTQNAREVMMQFVRTGGNAADAWRLYARAEDIAVTTGQTGNEVIQELIYGLQSGNTNLRIFRQFNINATDAQATFAASIGKSKDQLTDAEKQTALFNAVMAKTGNIAGIAGKMLQEGPFNWAAMQAPIQNLREAVGGWLEPAFTLVGRSVFQFTRELTAAIMEGGKFYPVVQTIREMFKSLAQPIANIIQRFRDFIANVSTDQVKAFAGSLKELAPLIPAVGAALMVFAGRNLTQSIPVIGQLAQGLNPVTAAFLGLVLGMPEVRSAFTQLLRAIVPLLQPLLQLARVALGQLAAMVLKLVQGALPIFTRLIGALMPIVGRLVPVVLAFVDALGGALIDALDALLPLLPSLADLAVALLPSLVSAARDLLPVAVDMLRTIMPLVSVVALMAKGFLDLITPIKPLSTLLGVMLVGAFIAWKLSMLGNPWIMGATLIIGGLMALWNLCKPLAIAIGLVAAAFALWAFWSTVLNAIPIVAVIAGILLAVMALVAGIVWLVRNWSTVWGVILSVVQAVWNWIANNWKLLTVILLAPIALPLAVAAALFFIFRDQIVAVFGVIWRTIQWVWAAVLRPVFAAIGTAFTAAANAIKWAWAAIIQPTINVLWTIFRVVIALWLLPLFLQFRLAWWAVSTGFAWAWNNVIRPAINALVTVFTWMWQNIVQPIFNAFRWVWNQVATTFAFYWNNIIRPAWNALSAAISFAWNNVIHPIFARIQQVWTAVGNTIRWIINNVVLPAWEVFKGGIRTVRDVFVRIVDIIGTTWDKIRAFFRAPVKWVVNYAINPLIRGANLILRPLNLAVDEIKGFRRGGRVPGGWGGGDRVPILAEPGEWVLTKRQARAIGYGRLRGLPGYARGGMVEGPMARLPSLGDAWEGAKRFGRGALDFGGELVNKATNLIRFAAFKAFETFTQPFRDFLERVIVPRLGTGDWFGGAMGKYGIYLLDKLLDWVRGKSESEDATGFGMGIDEIVAQVRAHFPQLVVTSALRPGDTKSYHSKNLARDLGGPVPVMAAAGSWIQATLAAALLEGIHNPTLSVKDGKIVPASLWGPATWAGHRDHIHLAAEAAIATAGGSVGEWLAQAIRITGVNPAIWSQAVAYQIQRESGGNVRAINGWDINAQKGTPSKGLMQVIDPTFAAYRDPRLPNDIWNPVANIAAAIRYIMGRYGANPHSLGRWRPGGGYDAGGWLPPGASIAINNTGRPEPVLTARQWDDLLASSGPGDDMRPVVELLRRIAAAAEAGTTVVIDGREVARVVDREIGWIA
jgi:hypothetical protein